MVFQFSNLSKLPWLGHAVSTKDFGNVSYFVGDKKSNVDSNRDKLFKSLDINGKDVVDAIQVHGNHVALITNDERGYNILDTDALITNKENIPLIVKVADCVPVFLADPVNKAAGVVHAGWRGTAQEIVKIALNHMEDHFGTNPSDLIVGIGPSIGPCCYQVDRPVIDIFSSFSYGEKLFSKVEDGHASLAEDGESRRAKLNLWDANRFQLVEAGVRAENIEVAGICTYDNTQDFFSARKEGRSGLVGAIAWIKA